MTRCYNPNSKSYKGYGDRGITVCAEWHDVAVLITWIGENLGPRREGMSLDRWPDKDGPMPRAMSGGPTLKSSSATCAATGS